MDKTCAFLSKTRTFLSDPKLLNGSVYTLCDARQTSHSKIMGINMELVPPFAAITASTLLGRLSTTCWNIAAGTLSHSATRAFVRSGTDVGRLCLIRSRRSNSSQRCLMGLKSGLCVGQSSSSSPISTNNFYMYLALYLAFPNCCHKVGSTESSRM